MGPNPFIGVIYHWIGGFASATNFIPFRGIKRWSWEIYWIIQGIAAWLIAPTLFALLFVPNLFPILSQAYHDNPNTIYYSFLWGVLWGIGGITFGLAIRYLGIALGYAIALGLCAFFGTIVPPIYHRQMGSIIHSHSGQIILWGLAVCLLGVAVNGAAGYSKEQEITPEEKAEAGERDFSFGKGIAIAILAGLMSAFFSFGLDNGRPLAALTKTDLLANHRLDLWQNLPVLIIVLSGGFLTNLIWSSILILKNNSAAQFFGEPGTNPMRATAPRGDTLTDLDPRVRKTFAPGRAMPDCIAPATLAANYFFAALAGIVWYFQFFFYSMGQTKMGKYDFSSWTLHMASIIIFATLWGLVLREWRGTSRRTRILVATGLFLLIGSTVIVGYGNYLKSTQPAITTASSN